jgi:hypothetical protein
MGILAQDTKAMLVFCAERMLTSRVVLRAAQSACSVGMCADDVFCTYVTKYTRTRYVLQASSRAVLLLSASLRGTVRVRR